MNETHFTDSDREKLDKLGSDMKVLMEAVTGDKFNPEEKPGLLNMQIASSREWHGDPKTNTEGYKSKVDRVIEDVANFKMDKVKVAVVGTVIMSIGGGAVTVIVWILAHFKIIPV